MMLLRIKFTSRLYANIIDFIKAINKSQEDKGIKRQLGLFTVARFHVAFRCRPWR